MNNMNVIAIEKNIPIPATTWYGAKSVEKYKFMESMEISDSFRINGNTPDFTPASVRSYVYGLNALVNTNVKYAIRTIKGPSAAPDEIRVWRVK